MNHANHAPTYRFSPAFVARVLASMLLGRRRDAVRDGLSELARLGVQRRVEGLEHVPADGPCILVMNHYERPGLRVWWAAWFVLTAVAERRGGEAVRWMVTDRFYGYRLLGVPIPEGLVAWFLGRIARTYGLLPVARADVARRGPLLRRAYRLLHEERCALGVTPEAGNEGDGRTLVRPVRGSTASIAWLARNAVPVVPVAVYEDGTRTLIARFGQPLDAEDLGTDVLVPVARLLPEELRGPYVDVA